MLNINIQLLQQRQDQINSLPMAAHAKNTNESALIRLTLRQ